MTVASKERTGLEVRLENLHRTFGTTAALDGLSLTIAPGELVALLGPSGCGKTTALRIVAGLDEPDSGKVVVGERDVTFVSASKRDMGMVFQAYSLFPHLTSQQNVEFGLKLRGVDGAKRSAKAREMLDLVGLAEFANRYASQLSGGQQQRVALARALAIEPSVLLLDEPLSALDAQVRAQLRDEIRRIQLEIGTTTIFVTHDQEEALAIADRVGVMNNGKLAQLDAPEELYARPADSFVAGFVGLMNRLPCNVAGGRTELLGASVKTLENSVDSGPGLALVRPEQLSVQAADTGTARVKHLSFLGSFSRATVALADSTELVVQIPAVDASRLALGSRVDVAVTTPAVFVARPD